jgi:hypothetical protein
MGAIERVIAIAVFGIGLTQAQQPVPTGHILPGVPDETVVAEFGDGRELSAGELRGLYLAMDPQVRAGFERDPMAWLRRYATFRHLATLARKEQLDQMSPIREALEYSRILLLSQFMINAKSNTTPVPEEEIRKAYQAEALRYSQARVRVLYVANGAGAEAKAARLAQSIREGADFVEQVRAHSEDSESRARDGDPGMLRSEDRKLPEGIRKAVFGARAGVVLGPLREANGFYLLRVEEVRKLPLEEVRNEIHDELQARAIHEWLDRVNRESAIKIVDEKALRSLEKGGAKKVE